MYKTYELRLVKIDVSFSVFFLFGCTFCGYRVPKDSFLFGPCELFELLLMEDCARSWGSRIFCQVFIEKGSIFSCDCDPKLQYFFISFNF